MLHREVVSMLGVLLNLPGVFLMLMRQAVLSAVTTATFLVTACPIFAGAVNAHVIEDRWHVFSRSCGAASAQESITYAFFLKRWLYVVSEHYLVEPDGSRIWLHNVSNPGDGGRREGWHFGKHARAGHWGEEWYGHVTGHHWALASGSRAVYKMWDSDAVDCNLDEY
jgi:hypothetical protein